MQGMILVKRLEGKQSDGFKVLPAFNHCKVKAFTTQWTMILNMVRISDNRMEAKVEKRKSEQHKKKRKSYLRNIFLSHLMLELFNKHYKIQEEMTYWIDWDLKVNISRFGSSKSLFPLNSFVHQKSTKIEIQEKN